MLASLGLHEADIAPQLHGPLGELSELGHRLVPNLRSGLDTFAGDFSLPVAQTVGRAGLVDTQLFPKQRPHDRGSLTAGQRPAAHRGPDIGLGYLGGVYAGDGGDELDVLGVDRALRFKGRAIGTPSVLISSWWKWQESAAVR